MKGTISSLLRTTLEQVGLVKDAVERQAKNQRVWLDSALLHRKHREALTALGEVVYSLAASGELGELEEYPEIARQLAILVELEQHIAETAERAREASESARQAAERFVQRASWPAAEVRRRVFHRPGERDWREAAGFPEWDDSVDYADELDDDPFDQDDDAPPARPARSPRSKPRRQAAGGGGIAFDPPREPDHAGPVEGAFVEADFGGDLGDELDDGIGVVALGDHLHSSAELARAPDAAHPAPESSAPRRPTKAAPRAAEPRDKPAKPKPGPGSGRDPEN